MNYNVYHFSAMEVMFVVIQSFLVAGTISYLFYRSIWAMILFPIILFLLLKRKRENAIEKRKKLLHGQFIDCLKIVCTNLMAGMSMENAWREGAREIGFMHGAESVLYPELKEIVRLVENNVPIEQVILNFSYRTGVADIISFGEVFEYGKRNGGDWRKLIEDTTFRMEEKYETEKEIEVMIAAKRIEQRIMNVIPLGMILFLRMSSGSYMDVLYGNAMGIVCMSVCLLVYAAAFYLSEKIMKIQV